MPTNARDIVVFVGPSLPWRDAEALLQATYLPPVQQGSVYEAAQSHPRAIVLIDGYFGWVPSVWHKEILWALDQGIAVYGAASMGALRAVELCQFGMVGHGVVFRDFGQGRLLDDDEVAIVHADAEDGFRPLSDAMVNIRYTLEAAAQRELISASAAAALIGYCKRQFFVDRHLARLVAQAEGLSAVTADELERLAAWLPDNMRDVKREDAESLLQLLAEEGPADASFNGKRFVFQPTANWLQLTDYIKARQFGPTKHTLHSRAVCVGVDDLLTECRLDGTWPAVEAMALARLLSANPSSYSGTVTEEEYLTELAHLCLSLGLESLEEVSSWLRTVGWESSRLARLVEIEVLLRRARDYWMNDLQEAARHVLILNGRDKPLLDRARRKRRWLDSIGGRSAVIACDPTEGLAWFRDQISSPRSEPDEVLAQRNGWSSVSDMREDVVCEYGYHHAIHRDGA